MKHMNAATGFALSSVVVASSLIVGSGAAAVLERDFQSNAPGPIAGTGIFVSGAGAAATVVAGANDVFGGGANQSLKLHAPNTGSVVFYAIHDVAPAAGITTTGTFSTRFFHAKSAVDSELEPFTELKVGVKNTEFMSGTNIAMWLGINGDNTLQIFNAGPAITTDQSISLDAAHTLTLDFDVVAGNFTMKVDGNAITAGGGAQSVFPFANPVSAVNALELSTPSSSRTGTVYLDNIVIDVPEPGSMGLLAAGLLVMMRRKSRAA